jgi:hypothetical protein
MLADAMEVCDQAGKAPAKMRVGNLGDAKFGHGRSIAGANVGTMTRTRHLRSNKV